MNRREFAALAASGILLPDHAIPSLKPHYRKQLLESLGGYIKKAIDHHDMQLFTFLCAVHRAIRREKESEAFDLISMWAFADAQKEARGE